MARKYAAPCVAFLHSAGLEGIVVQGLTMQAAAIDGFGRIEKITLQTVPVPEVRPADVLIRVEAAGVGSWDAVEREGQYDGAFGFESTFPYVLGWDGAGKVAAVGEQVTRFAVGDRVYAASMPLPRGGFYAEYAVVEEEHSSILNGFLRVLMRLDLR